MPSSPIRSVGAVLSSDPELGTITRQAKRLLTLQRALASTLPEAIAHHATFASVATGTAVILAKNGTVAAKLRQMTPRLLANLRQLDPEINAIQVRAQGPSFDKPLPEKQISLSSAARKALKDLSMQLPSSPLRSSVDRLARAIDSRSDDQQESFKRKQTKQNQ